MAVTGEGFCSGMLAERRKGMGRLNEGLPSAKVRDRLWWLGFLSLLGAWRLVRFTRRGLNQAWAKSPSVGGFYAWLDSADDYLERVLISLAS